MIRFRKTKPAQRKRDARDLHLQFGVDSLEQRRMLAGEVTTSLAGGSLILSGDGQDNVVAMFQVNGSYGVLGIDTAIEDADFAATEFGIDFELKLIDGVTKDITAILRGGDDTFLIGGSAEGIDLGDAFASIDPTFDTAVVPRDLKIFTNGGRDNVLVTGTEVGRDLIVDTGFGLEDNVIIGRGGIALAVLDAIQDFDFDDLASFSTSSFGGGYEILGEIAYALLSPVEIGRDLKIFGESSDDAIYVGGASIGRDAIINSNIGEDNLYFGTGAVVEVDFGFPTASAEGALGDFGSLELDAYVYVGRNALLNTGDGDDVAWIGGQRHFYFDIDYIPRQDFDCSLCGFTFEIEGGVEVEKDLRLNVSSHDDLAYVGVGLGNGFDVWDDVAPKNSVTEPSYNVYVGRDMDLLTAADDDYVQIGGALDGDFNGDVDLVQPSDPEGVLKVERNLTINTDGGTDEVVIGETLWLGDFLGESVSLEGEESTFFLIDIGRNMVIDTGWHDDEVIVAGSPLIGDSETGLNTVTSTGNLRVGRDMLVNTDGGNDVFVLGEVDFDILTLEAATNNVGPNGDSKPIEIGRDLKVQMGDQDDLVEIDFTYVGDDMEIRTWWGRDEVVIGTKGTIAGDFGVCVGDQLKIDTSLERDTIELSDISVGGNAAFNTGIRDDELIIGFSDFGGNFRAIMGGGNDLVDMVSVSVVGDIRLDMQDGHDEVTLFESTGGSLRAIMGSGDDLVELLSVDVFSQIRLDMQAGDDDVDIFDTTGDRLMVFGGTEDDNVCIFSSAFGSGAILDGGPGEDGLSTDLPDTPVNFEGPATC